MDFTKYNERGAYHWQSTYDRGILYSSPRLHARYDLIIRLLARSLDLKRTCGVDMACGDGVLIYKLRKLGSDIAGLDNAPEAIALARQALARKGVSSEKLFVASCYETGLGDASLDYVTAAEIIEHLDDVDSFLKEVNRILRPGGLFVCTTPNREANPGGGKRDPHHVKEFSPQELAEALESCFRGVQLYGAYPRWLERIYGNPTGIRWANVAVRATFKLFAFGVVNPYTHTVNSRPRSRDGMLLAVATKP
jgi:ubiquinone/menaquinone biosynthesis C-methylase UbiE